MSRLASLAWLGWRFAAVQPARKALRRSPAKARFAAAWFPEGLRPTAPEELDVALAAAACTGCGLCEVRCRLPGAPPRVAGLGLQALFRLHTKHPAELAAAAPLLEACTGEAGCRDCDDACPAGVPIARIVLHLRARLRASGAGGGPG